MIVELMSTLSVQRIHLFQVSTIHILALSYVKIHSYASLEHHKKEWVILGTLIVSEETTSIMSYSLADFAFLTMGLL